MNGRTERIRFTGSQGADLAARLDLPAGDPKAYVLFAHCFTCSKDLHAAVRISRALCDRGLGVFRFDFTGLGESGGEFAETDFSSNLDDLVSAADFLGENYRAPQILVGHSLGGAAVLAAAHRIPESRGVVTIAAPSDTSQLRDLLLKQAPELIRNGVGKAEVDLAGRTIEIGKNLVDDLGAQNLQQSISQLGRALLVLHSPVDRVVGIENARRIFDAADHPKSFVSLDGADHLLLSRASDASFVAEVVAAWASRYIEPEAGSEQVVEASDELRRVVVESVDSGYANRVSVRGHRWMADEPVRLGGTDKGPTPYELLLAGLGACKSITMRMYAERKGWPLEGVRIGLRHERIHAKDCIDCETDTGKIDRLEVDVRIQGPLSDEQVERLLRVADRCPVHRTLNGEIDIRSRLTAES